MPAHKCESVQTGAVSGAKSALRFEVPARAFIAALFVARAVFRTRYGLSLAFRSRRFCSYQYGLFSINRPQKTALK
jgi:hypothetical protein